MRKLLIAVLVAGAIASWAGPAQAKGPLRPVSGKLMVTGPGLDRPIVLRGTVYWDEWTSGAAEGRSSELTLILQQLGLLSSGPDVGWYVLPPGDTPLGPGYKALEYLGVNSAVPTLVLLYPYAEGRPMVNSSATARSPGLWWSAPPALRAWLVAHGLPSMEPTQVLVVLRSPVGFSRL